MSDYYNLGMEITHAVMLAALGLLLWANRRDIKFDVHFWRNGKTEDKRTTE